MLDAAWFGMFRIGALPVGLVVFGLLAGNILPPPGKTPGSGGMASPGRTGRHAGESADLIPAR